MVGELLSLPGISLLGYLVMRGRWTSIGGTTIGLL